MLRALIACCVVLATALPHAAAQPATKVPRIGVLTFGFAPSTAPVQAFRAALRELGYVEGKNIVLEYRFAEGRADRLPNLADELVRRNVDLLVTESSPAAVAAKQATATIPVVTATVMDPVRLGLVPSLSRPGGNITGLTLAVGDRTGKQLQLLKELAPKVGLVAVMYNAARSDAPVRLKELEGANRSLGLQLKLFAVRGPADLDGAFEEILAARPAALVTMGDGMLWGQRRRIVEFTVRNRLPAVFPQRDFADEGGLIGYGPNLVANFRRAAAFVDRILKGAKPGDLPIEQPTQFDLVINLRTAQSLGLKIPQSLLVRADDLIR